MDGRGGGGRPDGGGGQVGGNLNPGMILDRVLANPVREILGLRDTLQLTPEQVGQLEAGAACGNSPIRRRSATTRESAPYESLLIRD